MVHRSAVAFLALALAARGSAENDRPPNHPAAKRTEGTIAPQAENLNHDELLTRALLANNVGYIDDSRSHPKYHPKPLMSELRLRQQPGAVLVIEPDTREHVAKTAPKEAEQPKSDVKLDTMYKRRAGGIGYVVK